MAHGDRDREAAEPAAPNEDELTEALLAGDRAAAERLVDLTYQRIFASLCRLCGDRDLAADLTQETYRRAWSALDGFAGSARLGTWLYRIAYTTFLNHVRRPRPVGPLDDERAVALADPAESADARVERGAREERLRRAVLALPEDLRYTVTARYWADLPVRTIAEQAGVTTVAIRKRLNRARQHLALALEDIDR